MQENLKTQIDQFMADTLFFEDLPGLVIGAGLGTDFIYEGAAGYKDFLRKEPMETANVFHMASVSKLFVGTAVLRLMEKGKLSLSDKVAEILEWFTIDDKRYKEITLEHLLTHTAGIGDVSDYEWDKPRIDENALSDYVRSEEVSKSKLIYPPGQGHFSYSNIGYEILGCVIAEVSGMSFDEFAAKELLAPLRMNNSTFLTFERADSLELPVLSAAGLAMPHIKDSDKHIVYEPQYPYNRAHGPSSTLTSNLADMKKWADAHLQKKVLNPETYDLAWKKMALVQNNGEHIGLSWFIREQSGYTLYGHEGNDDGFRASFWICPALSAHVVVMSNLSKAPVKKIGKKVFDLLFTTL